VTHACGTEACGARRESRHLSSTRAITRALAVATDADIAN